MDCSSLQSLQSLVGSPDHCQLPPGACQLSPCHDESCSCSASSVAGAASVASGPYNDGYVLPGDNSSGAFTLPLTVTTTQRYLKVFFYSDISTTANGWDIDIETTATVANPNTGLGAFVYLDATDVARGTNQIGTGRLIGIATGGTTADNATVIFVEPPRVT